MMEPVRPTPIVATSTDFKRSAISVSCPLRQTRGYFRIHVHVTVAVLGEAHRQAVDPDAMLVDDVVIRCIRPGEPDHAPRDHVAIAAVNGITEETFDSTAPK